MDDGGVGRESGWLHGQTLYYVNTLVMAYTCQYTSQYLEYLEYLELLLLDTYYGRKLVAEIVYRLHISDMNELNMSGWRVSLLDLSIHLSIYP
jgi:hypothetical protein